MLRTSFVAKRLFTMAVVLTLAGITAANAADCRKYEDVKKRLGCIEDKIDATPAVDLQGVKIESSQAHGQCANYIDHDKVLVAKPCGTDFGTWNIHK